MVKINNTEVGQVGFGLMGMSPLPFPPPPPSLPYLTTPSGLTWRASPPSESQSFSAMKTALTHNSTFWNGGELYGTPSSNSLQLLASYFTAHPSDASKVVLSIKGGCIPGTMAQPDGSAANIRRSIDECLRVLDGKKSLDLFEAARLDPNVPVEETVGAIVEYIREGKVGGLSLSEVNAATIRKVHAIHPVAAVEVEFSLWSTDILENGVAETCGELGIPIVAYSPLGRGFLASVE